MKNYLVPIAIAVLFSACNDSQTEASKDPLSANSTVIEQTLTQVDENKTEIKEIEQQAPTVIQPMAKAEISGESIFGKCKSCHGNSAEKHALGASQIIEGWDVAKIEAALKGYQKGTYGGSMKNVMAAQAKSLSDEEIKKVAVYIHSL